MTFLPDHPHHCFCAASALMCSGHHFLSCLLCIVCVDDDDGGHWVSGVPRAPDSASCGILLHPGAGTTVL